MPNLQVVGQLSASRAIKERQALIQRASLDARAEGTQEPGHIDCWMFNEHESRYETYKNVEDLQRTHGELADENLALTSVVPLSKEKIANQSPKTNLEVTEVTDAVRWFHTSGNYREGVESLGSIFGINSAHYSNLTCDEWECEFVCGKTARQDYLRIAVNELCFLHYDKKSADAAAEAERLSSRSKSNRAAVHATDELALEEVPLLMFLFPDLGVLITVGSPGRHEALLEAARLQLLNRRSILYREYMRGMVDKPLFNGLLDTAIEGRAAGRAAGCGSLLVVLLDALIDEIFPTLDVFGDVIEGVQIINDKRSVAKRITASGQQLR